MLRNNKNIILVLSFMLFGLVFSGTVNNKVSAVSAVNYSDFNDVVSVCEYKVNVKLCTTKVLKCRDKTGSEAQKCYSTAIATSGPSTFKECNSVDDVQACQKKVIDQCKKPNNTVECRTRIANNLPKPATTTTTTTTTPSTPSNQTATSGGLQTDALPGDPVDLNAKRLEDSDNWCGEKGSPSSIKTQINLGCTGKGNAIVDLTFAVVKFLTYGVGIVLVLAIIYSGIMYSSSTGNPEQTQKAKNRIRDVVIALVFYLLIGALMNYLIPGGLT